MKRAASALLLTSSNSSNTIVAKLDLVYPLKNDIDAAAKQVNDWILVDLKCREF